MNMNEKISNNVITIELASELLPLPKKHFIRLSKVLVFYGNCIEYQRYYKKVSPY